MENDWLLYILECADGSYYTGITKDFKLRLKVHNDGKGSRYTRARLPVHPLFTLAGLQHHQAAVIEAKVKRLSRKQKEEFMSMKGNLWSWYQKKHDVLMVTDYRSRNAEPTEG